MKERWRLANAVGGLPVLHGILAGIHGILDRLDPVRAELKVVEVEKAEALEASRRALDALSVEADTGTGVRPGTTGAVLERIHHAAALVRLRGIGSNDALLLGAEVFYRDFRNRRELAGLAGLAPVPWVCGGVDHDQGNGRAGSPMLRRHLVRMAWRWLLHQPDSALSGWFREYVSARDGRAKKRGILALWRYATTGPVPEGAVLSQG